MPETPVTTELMVRLFGNDRRGYATITNLPNTFGVDKNIFYKAGRGDCDKFGNFTFSNVADGRPYPAASPRLVSSRHRLRVS